MGLRPVLGRLLGPGDDGPKADGAAVLTYRFWTTAMGSDPAVWQDRELGIARDDRQCSNHRSRIRRKANHREHRDQPASFIATMVTGRFIA